tara:strand:- start:532 stop:1014 length:483 start_codon:yes stop_codon:yes gene_type:complete
MIGMDNKLKSSGAPAYAKTSDTAVTNANNNIIAGAAGAGRAAQQKMGGRGMSAGRGQQARADRAQDSATIKGYLGAATNDMKQSSLNATIDSAWDNQRKNNDLTTDGLLRGLQSSQYGVGQLGMGGNMDSQSNNAYLQSSAMGFDKLSLARYLTQGQRNG